MPNAKILRSSFGPEDLYPAHGRGDGFAPQLWSPSEHPPSKCGACRRELYSYDMSEVIGGFG
ncbi:aldehyde dehydrogenase [Streptomyces sp. NPDC001455]|uniref:aldehyde dehydrogenase n=1 Tax=unclassified Streptomyces TaxID=2593676 RepID=UPI003324652A